MKLRLAKKIIKFADSGRYNDYQINKALDRTDKTQSVKDDNRYWKGLMNTFKVDRLIEEGKFDEALEIVKTQPIVWKVR